LTKPVQEPSGQRALANQNWAIQQLQRRPAPPGSIPPTWRGFSTVDQTCPSGDDIVIHWDEWENSDNTVFQEVFSGSDTTSVRLLRVGIYSIYTQYVWETFADNQLYWITVQTGWNFPDTIHQTRWGWPSVGNALGLHIIRTLPPYPEPLAAPYGEVDVYAGQASGVPRDVDAGGAVLEILYLGPFPSQWGS
jgi:hypothetical protein